MLRKSRTLAFCLVFSLFLLNGCGGGSGDTASSNKTGGSSNTGGSNGTGGSNTGGSNNGGGSNTGGSNNGGSSTSSNGNATLQRVAKIILKPGEGSLYSGVIDPTNGYAYFSTSGSAHPGYIIKVALGVGNAPPVEVGSLQLPAGQEGVVTSVIDTVHGYAYFGNLEAPARIFKVALGAGNAPPQLVGSTVLNAGENTLLGSAIDAANGYAYFATGANPCNIVKVSLGQGNTLPTRVNALTLPSGNYFRAHLMLDLSHGFGYAMVAGNSYQLLKLSLGAGDAPPSQVSSLTFPAEEGNFGYAEIDTSAGYAYVTGSNPGNAVDDTTPGIIVKVRLNAGDAAPSRIGALTVPQKFFSAGGLDPYTHYLYLGNDLSFPTSSVLQVATGQGDSLPTLINTIHLQPGTKSYTFATRPSPADPVLAGEIYIRSGVIDPAAGYVYFGTDTHPGQVIKVAIPRQ